ncbi:MULTISPECIES: membrane protein insertase YidC [unclassified Gordonia (in: high G+C Gram-positive bacteria)]|uniref:membrane protein insertase YidC n=1 Tax=unclassified Gordonia (in: high G+C Gram-positive bacteria) TaxID=2657482 RepID=UPI001F115E54|nr:membrane protein insertase YidC [Gordonia sp. ABSL49_1]MCH5641356.1 membrane protein insertase YidC [Gordonia sp. ABSL49_1]
MLNFIYYPVSGIMWVWHWLFDHITPNTPGGDGIAWALSVVFLVFTLRAILYKPFVKQIRTTKKMQEINPELQAIRKKYAKDRVKMTEEMQKLQKEHGFNPLLGCLPMLLQIPVFIGLFHVLRSFNRTATGMGQLGMSVEETRNTPNYFFSVEQVQNFLDARLFGVPLSSFITQPVTEWPAFGTIDFTRAHIAVVVIPMMIIASIATHMNSRASVARQPEAALENPQTRMMNMLALYIFPLGILVTGPFFPVAILLYWMSNNIWTYGQQHLVFGRIAKEEEEAKLAKQEKLKANSPKPGAKPVRMKKGQASTSDETDASDTPSGTDAAAAETDKGDDATTAPTEAGAKPKPGQKPARPGQRSGSGSSPGSKKQNSGNRGGKKATNRGGRRGGRR